MPKRVLLKLSGEVLMGNREFGIDAQYLKEISAHLVEVVAAGYELAVVVGGGNIFRGVKGASEGINRASGDYMGMLATIMNAVALQDAIEKHGTPVRVLSALNIPELAEQFIQRRGIRHLEKGRIVVLAAGTGNPFFTTDSAAALRALELKCDVMLKATKVNGIYDKDPAKHDDAIKYETITYTEALAKNLQVMDASALSLARDNDLPVRVFSIKDHPDVINVLKDESIGTTLHA
jgi:uridylate kinase